MHLALVGCGQLSRMLALAGKPMGFKFSFVADPAEDIRCVEGMGAVVRWQPGDSVAELYKALGQPDRVTVEKEQVDVSLLTGFQEHCQVHPNHKAFAACQHRHREKQLLDKLDIPCASYSYGQPADTHLSLPVVVKSCREGYDGKNQWILKNQHDVDAFSDKAEEENYIVEQLIPFEKEVSQVSVRGANGEVRHYPLTENTHEKGILRQSIAPAMAVSDELQSRAQDYIKRIMDELDYVGVIAMECFLVKDQLLVNELAPRVHNSGHWTQSGSVTCQFENHMRAVSGLPLGSTEIFSVTGMVNLIGTEKAPLDSLTAQSQLHWYDKEVRVGRKLGHINIVGEDHQTVLEQMRSLHGLSRLA